MEKKIFISMKLLVAILMPVLWACSGGGDDGNGGGGGSSSSGGAWYARPLYTSFPITESGYGYYTNYVLAHVDEFFDSEGRYGGYINLPDGTITHGPAYGRDEIEVLHIANDNTIEFYEGYLYKCGSSGTSGRRLLYKVTGSPLGDVGFYATSPDYYSYTRDGNVIKVKVNGTIENYTITSDGLLIGGGEKCPQFSLGKTFFDNGSNNSSSEDDIAEAQSISKTASVIGTPTFHRVKFKCSFSSPSSGGNGNYKKVFAYSTKKSDLENASEMARRYHLFDGGREVHDTDSYEPDISPGKVHDLDNGYFQDGDLRFADEQVADLSNITAEYDELNVTVYYCPVIMVSTKALIGDIQSVSLRQLKQTSGFVDLGLSCKWSATNNKASSPWDFGSSIILNNANVSGGGRLPTKEEVLELNKCSMEVIDNGVLVKGSNGNEIFIPFRNTTGNTVYPGYGTGSTQKSGSYTYDVLFDFDTSSRKFTTKRSSSSINYGRYTMHTSAYVRPVIGDSGGSGGGGGTQSNVLTLADMLQKPFGVVDADFATSSFNTVVQALQNKYNVDAGSVPDQYDYFMVYAKDNTSLADLKYLGTGIWSFRCLVGNGNGYFTSPSYSYFFYMKIADWGADKMSLMSVMHEEFANLGITLIDDSSTTAYFAIAYGYKGNIQYRVYLKEDGAYYHLEIGMMIF